jgi:hypothetical protein
MMRKYSFWVALVCAALAMSAHGEVTGEDAGYGLDVPAYRDHRYGSPLMQERLSPATPHRQRAHQGAHTALVQATSRHAAATHRAAPAHHSAHKAHSKTHGHRHGHKHRKKHHGNGRKHPTQA